MQWNMPIEANNWDVKTYRNKLEKQFFPWKESANTFLGFRSQELLKKEKIYILTSNVGNYFNKILNWFLYFRHDADVMEESLNDEELAADAAITETFQKLVARVSMKSFNAVLEKLKRYAQNHILEPAVAGM